MKIAGKNAVEFSEIENRWENFRSNPGGKYWRDQRWTAGEFPRVNSWLISLSVCWEITRGTSERTLRNIAGVVFLEAFNSTNYIDKNEYLFWSV